MDEEGGRGVCKESGDGWGHCVCLVLVAAEEWVILLEAAAIVVCILPLYSYHLSHDHNR